MDTRHRELSAGASVDIDRMQDPLSVRVPFTVLELNGKRDDASQASLTAPVCIVDDDVLSRICHDLGLSYRRDGDLMTTGSTGAGSSAGLRR
jgi:hypothetical protein